MSRRKTASVCTDPHLAGEPAFTAGVPIAETAFDTVNFALTSASTNAIGTGVSIPGLTMDYNGATRDGPPHHHRRSCLYGKRASDTESGQAK